MNESKERREKHVYEYVLHVALAGIWGVIRVCCGYYSIKNFVHFIHGSCIELFLYGKSDRGRRDCFSSVVVVVERSQY